MLNTFIWQYIIPVNKQLKGGHERSRRVEVLSLTIALSLSSFVIWQTFKDQEVEALPHQLQFQMSRNHWQIEPQRVPRMMFQPRDQLESKNPKSQQLLLIKRFDSETDIQFVLDFRCYATRCDLEKMSPVQSLGLCEWKWKQKWKYYDLIWWTSTSVLQRRISVRSRLLLIFLP